MDYAFGNDSGMYYFREIFFFDPRYSAELNHERAEARMRGLVGLMAEPHKRVLDTFDAFRLKIGPVPVVMTLQDEIKNCAAIERHELGLPDSYYNAFYSRFMGTIYFDAITWISKPGKIEGTLAHEYGHRLYDMVMGLFQELRDKATKNRQASSQVSTLLLSGPTEDPIETLKRHVDSVKGRRFTETEKKRLTFENYLHEMFAETVAVYVSGHPDPENTWRSYSEGHYGMLDRSFMRSLERVLYEAFLEGMYRDGLRQTAKNLPEIYLRAGFAFGRRYQRQLPPVQGEGWTIR